MFELCGDGRTIVIVTHGLSLVRMMATSALWLHQGRVAEYGDPDEVVNAYMRYCRIDAACTGSMTIDLIDRASLAFAQDPAPRRQASRRRVTPIVVFAMAKTGTPRPSRRCGPPRFGPVFQVHDLDPDFLATRGA